jgi:hypothetical protein
MLDQRPEKFAPIFSTGKVVWLEKLLAPDCVYTFGHKHTFSGQ